MKSNGRKFKWLKFVIKFSLPVIAFIVFLSTRFASHNPDFVETYYSQRLYPIIAEFLTRFSSLFRFSVWDLFWTLVILVLLVGILLVFLRKIRVGIFFLRFIQVFSVLYIWFYFSWGYNYFRADIEKRMKWTTTKPDQSEFRNMLDTIIVRTNKSYVKIDSAGFAGIDSLLEVSYRQNSPLLNLAYPSGSRRVKPMLYSKLFAMSGMSGYFGPFFNEVHVNEKILSMDYPFAVAHEKAHQYGIGSEAEANLIAYVICSSSEDKRIQYSASLMILLYFLNDAEKFPDYGNYLKKIDRHVIANLIYRYNYYKGVENETLDKVHSAANNAYLRANNIHEGIENYDRVVELVMRYRNSLR